MRCIPTTHLLKYLLAFKGTSVEPYGGFGFSFSPMASVEVRPPPPPSETVRGSIPFDDIIAAMGVLSSEKPQAADEEWSACTAQAGDVVAVLDMRGGHSHQ